MINLSEKPVEYDNWRAAEDAVDHSGDGWLKSPKGLKQYLWERGWWHDGMTIQGNKDHNGVMEAWSERMMDDKGNSVEVEVSSSMREVCMNLLDFQEEVKELQQLCTDLGHDCDFTPKAHAEFAGEAVEYLWGVSARHYRRYNSAVHQRLVEETTRALSPLVLGKTLHRRMERLGWRYKETYRRVDRGDGNEADFKEVERLQRQLKHHRDANFELAITEGRRVNPFAMYQ